MQAQRNGGQKLQLKQLTGVNSFVSVERAGRTESLSADCTAVRLFERRPKVSQRARVIREFDSEGLTHLLSYTHVPKWKRRQTKTNEKKVSRPFEKKW